MSIIIPDTSGELIAAVCDSIYYIRPSYNIEPIKTYIKSDQITAERALEAAVLLGYVVKKPDGSFVSVDDLLLIHTHSNIIGRRIILRYRLELFLPFQRFKERIYCGDSPLEAADKVKTIFNVVNDTYNLKEILTRWGIYSGAFTTDTLGDLQCASPDSLLPTYMTNIDLSLKNIEKARVFIQERLGEEYFNIIPTEIIDGLSSALVKCVTQYEPKSASAFAIGTSMEKFLAYVAANNSPTIDLTGANGLSQMGEILRSNSIITKKHIGLIHAIATLRNAADHGVDVEIGKSWQLSNKSILDFHMITLDAMKSIMDWTKHSSATL